MPRRRKDPPPPLVDDSPSLDADAAREWFGRISYSHLTRLTMLLDIPTHYNGRKRQWKRSDLARARQMLERHKVPWSVRSENIRRRQRPLSDSQTDV